MMNFGIFTYNSLMNVHVCVFIFRQIKKDYQDDYCAIKDVQLIIVQESSLN